jgi:hypothetical protein
MGHQKEIEAAALSGSPAAPWPHRERRNPGSFLQI